MSDSHKKIPVLNQHGEPVRYLLAKFVRSSKTVVDFSSLLETTTGSQTFVPPTVFLYLHGFPDLSVHPTSFEFASRLPRKICQDLMARADAAAAYDTNDNDDGHRRAVKSGDSASPKAGSPTIFPSHLWFVCFNFSGLPGSDLELFFEHKRISAEVQDLIAVLHYLRMTLRPKIVHVLGLSTGAIIASIVRGLLTKPKQEHDRIHSGFDGGGLCNDRVISEPSKDKDQVSISPHGSLSSMTFIALAGLLDLPKGTEYDFSIQQKNSFFTYGYCWKEFYLPEDCLPQRFSFVLQPDLDSTTTAQSNRKASHSGSEIGLGSGSGKIYAKLNRSYYDECLQPAKFGIDIPSLVTRENGYPFLIMHGEKDIHVPIEQGMALFKRAAQPKTWIQLPQANHLITNTKALKKFLNEIAQWIIQHN